MRKRLILASASPRRRELLSLLRLPFDVVPSEVDEEKVSPVYPWDHYAMALAKEKAFRVWTRVPPETGLIVMGADTIVVSERGEPVVLGKPTGDEDARRMLRLLSGTTHTVYTGLSLVITDDDVPDFRFESDAADTQVTFRELTPAMIDAYIATGEPFDKAGGYGIQGYASAFVEAVYGDYFNVVGLPIQTAGRMLERIGIEWWRGAAALDSE